MAEPAGNEFEHRVALVPGGAGGIGSAVCRSLAQRGAAVTVADMDLERARTVAAALPGEGEHGALEVDVGDAAAVESAVAGLPRIDFLVYCAGNNVKGPSLELSAEQWRAALDSHLTGAFLFSQAVGRHLVAQGRGGRIVYISSVGAWAPIPERGAYSPSKAALNSLAGMLAVEWARYGICVNSVAFGTVVTPMTEVIRGPKFGAQTMARIPLGRYAETSDVAPSVCFLLAPGANYITGKNLTIDGGMTAM